MFDIQATIRWVTGVITAAQPTASEYKDTQADWQQSMLQITVPVQVLAYLTAAVIALLTGGAFMMGSFLFFVVSLIWVIGWSLAIAYIFNWCSNSFGGQDDFNAAYALIALSMIPAAVGTVLSPVPWIGWLLSLAASIYSLVLAYQFVPIFLQVPDESRVKHFVISIIAAVVLNLIVSSVLVSLFAPSLDVSDFSDYDIELSDDEAGNSSGSVTGGILGGFERQAQVAEEAANDTYEPPADGRLTEAQVERYVYVLEKSGQLRGRLTEKLQSTGEEENPSLGDVFGGIRDAVRAGTAEMEVVKTAGGNWAEHQWVRSQLETARIHEDLNDTTRHNYELYMQFKDQLDALGY